MKYHYIIVDFHTGQRIGKSSNERTAYEIAYQAVKRFGNYLTVNCYDNSGKSWRENFVFSGNECNWSDGVRIGN